MALTQVIGTGIGANNTVTSEGGAVTTSLQQGLAKSWFNYNQSTPVINDSLNIASVADNSTGNFTPSFTNAMANAIYGFPAISDAKHIQISGTPATGSFTLSATNSSNSSVDGIHNPTVHGDLA